MLDLVWGIGICSSLVAVMGSKSSDLAVLKDSDGIAARRFVAMDSEVVATIPKSRLLSSGVDQLGSTCDDGLRGGGGNGQS